VDGGDFLKILALCHNVNMPEGYQEIQQTGINVIFAVNRFTINIIKEISYTINLKHIPNKEVSWTLVTGDMMKVNNGKWTLKDLGGGKTEVNYNLEIEFKGFLPGLGMIEKTLVSTNLPLTMKAFSKRAQEL
jgi:ribosome-associated toxin RatA of RatAB toxin-antitoxin module